MLIFFWIKYDNFFIFSEALYNPFSTEIMEPKI